VVCTFGLDLYYIPVTFIYTFRKRQKHPGNKMTCTFKLNKIERSLTFLQSKIEDFDDFQNFIRNGKIVQHLNAHV
jgi:hypothetical protein